MVEMSNKYKNGFYCEASINKGVLMDALNELKLNIKNTFKDIKFQNPPYDPHITIIYSKTRPTKFVADKIERYLNVLSKNVNVRMDKLITLPYYDKKCIAIEFNECSLIEVNKILVNNFNLKPSFSDYLCHTSLLVFDSKENLDLSKIKIPKDNFTFKATYKTEDLDN